MPRYYTYLISSLPMLHFDARAPFSYERFLEKCACLVNADEFSLLSALARKGPANFRQPTLERIGSFETTLRNELVKLRASRKRVDPQKYLRPDSYAEGHIYHLALAAYRTPHILDGERIVDEARWSFLDELTVGHYFDFDYLICYAHKLLILERWERINTVDKTLVLEEALSSIGMAR